MVSKVYIVNPDKAVVSRLNQFVDSSPLFECMGSATDFHSAIKDINAKAPDIVVTGMNLNDDFSCWHLVDQIHHQNPSYLFLCTEDSEEAFLKTRKLQGSKYLGKPYSMLTMRGMLQDLHNDQLKLSVKIKAKNDHLYIKNKSEFVRLHLQDVLFLYSEGNYVTLHTDDQKFVFKYALTKLLTHKKFEDFVRVHRSYAINSTKVQRVNMSQKYMKLNEHKIPFGRTYVKNVRNLLDIGLR